VSANATEAASPKRRRSLATRQDIVEAAIACFIDIGYFRTTTTEIAKKAKVTRGAVQHYFPTTQLVLLAAIDYLQETWIEAFYAAAREIAPSKDSIDFAVENLWAFVNDPLHIAWQELVASSRTDVELREIIELASARYEEARRELDRATYPQFRDADRDKFAKHRDMLRFMLEGMATSLLTYDAEERIQSQLKLAKELLHNAWEPETSEHRIELKSE
jgi:AcrR family transcriptional regulator